MKSFKVALCVATLAAPSLAHAAVTPSLGGNTSDFLTLSNAGLEGGTVATLSGGQVYTADRPFADIPAGTVFGGNFLAAGPLAGQPATLTFTAPTSYLSFLWGSPDTWNRLILTTNQNSYTYTAMDLNFAVTNGNQAFSQYVQFATSGGELINSVTFTNVPATDAFEVASFSVAAVPEPATWAMMLVGFAMVGAASRYRRRNTSFTYA